MTNNKIYISIVTLFLVSFCFAQQASSIKIDQNRIHQFVYEVYEEDAKKIITEQPSKVEDMLSFLNNNIYFIQYKTIPSVVTEKLSNYSCTKPKFIQQEFNPMRFNPFIYGLEEVNEPKKIHIDNTNYVLFINPELEK